MSKNVLAKVVESNSMNDLSMKSQDYFDYTQNKVFSSLKGLLASMPIREDISEDTYKLAKENIVANVSDLAEEDIDYLAVALASVQKSCQESMMVDITERNWSKLCVESSIGKDVKATHTVNSNKYVERHKASKAMEVNKFMEIITPFKDIRNIVTTLQLERCYMYSNMLVTSLMDFRTALGINGELIIKDRRIDELRSLFGSANTKEWGLDRRLVSVQALSTLMGELSSEYGNGISPLFYFSG